MGSRRKEESAQQKSNSYKQMNKSQDHHTHGREQAVCSDSSLPGKNNIPNNRGGSTAAEESVATLIAQLGKINRDDPRAALEQIDEILRRGARLESNDNIKDSSCNGGHVVESQGSRDMKIHESANERNEYNDAIDGEEDEDSDSETTVSSITDPTFKK
jgi:hypothetical protein